jgi:3-isopropylmalate/(R)-2-methylmalate dehydratase small subunit
VWGLGQLGIRALVGTSFAGIFFDNCARNGLLAVSVGDPEIGALMARAADPARARFKVDLPNQEIAAADGFTVRFEIEPSRKEALLEGLDAVGSTLRRRDDIAAFERSHLEENPWLA